MLRERKLEPFWIERWFTKYELNVEINIAESGIQPFTLSEILAMADEDFSETKLGYIESGGSRELRELASLTYREKDWENVLVTTGGLEANFLLFGVLVQEGDEVVVEFPNYQQLYSVPKFFGAKIIPWRLREENNYVPDIEQLNELVSQRTRMIVINHPHNPTGSMIDNKALREICEIAQENGAYVLSDEVYLDLKPEGHNLDAACDISNNAISVQSMSKSYGLPGTRIGWITASKDIIDRCNQFREYVTLCSNVLGEKLAIIALKNREKIMERNRRIIRTNFEIVKNWIKKNDELSWIAPKGGVVAFPRYNLPLDSITLCSRLAEEEKVLIIPGTLFGDQDTEHHFRIGFGYETEKLVKGIEKIDHFLQKMK